MYYKKRSVDDPASATLHEIEYDIDVSDMIDSNEDEREVRLVFSKNPAADLCVAITPIKKKRGCSDYDEDEEVQDFELDAYKDWLYYLHSKKEALGKLR
jgi:retron-type reverse transcriptase